MGLPSGQQKIPKDREKETHISVPEVLTISLDAAVQGKILASKPLPPMREAFAKVRREESHKKLMFKASNPNQNFPVTESSALVTRNAGNSQGRDQGRGQHPWCDHCQKPGPTRGNCWKIHGKPADWKLQIVER